MHRQGAAAPLPEGDPGVPPAGDNDDILRDIGHLFDCEVTHSSEGLLWKRGEKD